MKNNIATSVFNFLNSTINELGFILYDVEYEKKQNGMNLTLFIQSKSNQPISLKDCELVHHKVDGLLDELNPTKDQLYYLNVSSVGIDRPLKIDKDFQRCIGDKVEIKLFSALENKKDFIGKLVSFDENNLLIEFDDQTINIARKNIALCKLYVEF